MRLRKYIDKGRSERYPMIFADFLIDSFKKILPKKNHGLPNETKPKILILANGHLGDALQISYLFPLIKKKYPNSEIHIVSGTWCEPIWKHNSLITKVFYLNDYRTNRKKTTKLEIWKEFLGTTKSTIRELKKTVYDFAFDVRYSDDALLFVLPFIKTKKSFGYGTRGLGGFLDIELELPPLPRHNMDWLLGLLKPLEIESKTENIQPYFEIPKEYKISLDQKIEKHKIGKDFYLILPESGAIEKMFEYKFWLKTIDEIIENNPESEILISGLTDYCDELAQLANNKKVKSIKKMLNIHEIGLLAEQSKGVLCLDSFPCHLCTIFTKVVTYFQIDHLLFLPINHYPIWVFHLQNPADWKQMNRQGFHNEQIESFDENLIKRSVKLLK